MHKKRSRLDIIGDMLSCIQQSSGKIKPTHLMYKANLSHQQMSSYLEELQGKEAIERSTVHGKKKDSDYILLTDKGHSLLAKIKEMKEFEQAFGL